MSFFKAYDMRGTFGVDFDLDMVYGVGKALPSVVAPGVVKPRFLIGRDCRMTGEMIRNALVAGLLETGAEVTDLGLCTTPMIYFFTAEDGFDGSVMITASHNPPSDNGLKVSKRGAQPVGYADGLDEVERNVRIGEWTNIRKNGNHFESFGGSPIRKFDNFSSRYVGWQAEHQTSDFKHQASNLSYAVDCSNGMASLLVKDLFPGATVINDTLDGRFPNHSPNPLKPEARKQVVDLVRRKKLDCGIIFDGDADRCMFVDERGEFVQPDYLIPVVAKATLGKLSNDRVCELSNARIIHDVRTSRGAIEELRRMGCEPVMVPVGHAFAKPILRSLGAICGGELAGHYYFQEFHCCDSGVLAALRILGEIAKHKAQGMTFSEMMAPISGVYANSGEINFRVEDKDAAIARVLSAAKAKFPHEVSRIEIDGIRIEYAEGWINIRKSNTEPYLRLLVECDSRERLDEWMATLKKAIEG